jgi:hypothetical protein
MKWTNVIIFCLVGSPYLISAQASSERMEHLAELSPTEVETRAPIARQREYFLQTPFAKPLIVDANDLFELNEATIEKIELVYTKFRESESFDQRALNLERINALNEQIPSIVENRLINWQLVEQTGCNSPESCDSLFHGFIITARHKPSRAESEREIADINKMLDLLPATPEEAGLVDKAPINPEDTASHIVYLSKGIQTIKQGVRPPPRDKSGYRPAYYGFGEIGILDYFKFTAGRPSINDPEEKYNIKLTIDERGYVESVDLKSLKGKSIAMPSLQKELMNMKWYPASDKGRNVSDEVDLTLVVSYAQIGLEKKGKGAEKKTPKDMFDLMPLDFDSTIIKVLDRNDWENIGITADLTGSMSKYTAQILYWIRLDLQMESSRLKHVTFFNDGDRKSNRLKYIGQTGGIYHIKATNFEEIKRTAVLCIRAGNGGDTPENNVEAILEAMRYCQECDRFIMAADNLATPRDIEIASQIQRPISIISCGATNEINPAYLNLARNTMGSLHTRTQDFNDLHSLREGEVFYIEGVKYEVKTGEIIASPY